ncbi:MAG: sugar phosphate isomerase/epimerase family protein [Deltaproteobacteria bacterium]
MYSHVHCHVPYLNLSGYMEHILARSLNTEIFLPSEALDSLNWDELAAQARALHDAGLATTIHAAFMDLNPGALDPSIRAVTRRRCDQVFQAAELLRPKVIVFHPGYDDLRYGENRTAWLQNSTSFWMELVPCAQRLGCIMALENIFEKEPSSLRELIEAVDSPFLRHCFDVGHWNMFATVTLEDWFAELGPYIAESHLHDNHGQMDEHLPVGEGKIDFDLVFGLLKHYSPEAVWTLEAHSLVRLERALKNVGKYIEEKAA